jgi:sulfite reductase alpha subunit-like flavoprotein
LSFRFNFIAKKLFKRLAQLGAQELVALGLADDQHDLGLVLVSVSVTKTTDGVE